MTEQIKYIPARLKSAVKGGHVTGAEDIDAGDGKTQQQVNNEVDDTLAFHQSEINALDSQNYVTVETYASLPATGEADTIYRVSSYDGTQVDATKYAEYAWNGSAYVLLDVKTQVGEVFDISQYKAIGGTLAKFADLAAALDGGDNVPVGVRKGGMSVKFVQSSDNKYVQYRLMADTWSINTADWSFCGDDVLVENPEYIEVKTDSEDKVLESIKTNGTKEINIPTTFKDDITIEGVINNNSLTATLNDKVDKVEGKSLIDTEYASSQSAIENPEWLQVTTDSEGKVLEGFNHEGEKIYGILPRQIKEYIEKIIDTRETIKAKIVNNDDAVKIPINSISAEEATLIKFKDKTFLFHSQKDAQKEVIMGHYYNPKRNEFTGEPWLVAGEENMGMVEYAYKCSYFLVIGEYLYGVVTLWGDRSVLSVDNRIILIKSQDGVNWSIENNNILDGVLPAEADAWWGNHCITYCPDNGYYYFFTEKYVSNVGWKLYVCRSTSINGTWEYICKCQMPTIAGVLGGPRVHYQDGKMKMIFHYSAVENTNTPTMLGYAEADINNLSYWTVYYQPLLDYNTRMVYPEQDQIADPELVEVDGRTYMIATYVQNFNPFQSSIWLWKCQGRLSQILQSSLEDADN